MTDYLLNVALAIDRLFTAIFRGDPGETLSSYAFRMDRDGKPWGFMRKVIDALFFFQTQHCAKAYVFDRSVILPK